MKIRNKITGQTFEVVKGTLYPSFFEEVTDNEIKVGGPKIEFEIEELEEEVAPEVVEEEPKEEKKEVKRPTKRKSTTKKGAKKNGNTKRN